MSERLTNVMIEAVKVTCWSMLASRVRLKETKIQKVPIVFDGISVIVGTAGKIASSLSLHCEDSSALKIVSTMMRRKVEKMGPEVGDGLGELLNIIAGAAKRRLSETVSLFDIAIPTVVTGRGHSVVPMVKWPTSVAVFESDSFGLTILVSARLDA